MKRLLYIFLGLSLILGCDENEDDESFAVNAFEGLWSGSFLNQENGSWTFSINENRDLIGSLTSKEYNKIYSLEGVVDKSGKFQATLFTASVLGEVGEFTGQLDEEAIFYLRSRGISLKNAEKICSITKIDFCNEKYVLYFFKKIQFFKIIF